MLALDASRELRKIQETQRNSGQIIETQRNSGRDSEHSQTLRESSASLQNVGKLLKVGFLGSLGPSRGHRPLERVELCRVALFRALETAKQQVTNSFLLSDRGRDFDHQVQTPYEL